MKTNNGNFTFIDLFAGIGGFHHALHHIGGRCVLACEMDPECRKVYEATLLRDTSIPFYSNIREITRTCIGDEAAIRKAEAIREMIPEHDVLCGGFPCQPFSKSGWQEGTKDRTRGTLFFDILQIINATKPKYLFLENVRNLAGPRHADTWKTIVASLHDEGYAVNREPVIFSPHLLSPKDGGAPQVRERVFIIGVRNDILKHELEMILSLSDRLARKEHWNPDRWDITDYLDDDNTICHLEKYRISKNESTYLAAWDYFVKNIHAESLPGFPIWAFAFEEEPTITSDMPVWEKDFRVKNSRFYNEHREFIDGWMNIVWSPSRITVRDFPFSRQKFEWQARKRHPKRLGRTIEDLVVQFRPSGIRVKPPTYLPALVAITQTSVIGPKLRGHGCEYRKLTPAEACRLQGFPDDMYSNHIVDDNVAYRQLGNAVNVGLVAYVSHMLLNNGSANVQLGNKQLELPGISACINFGAKETVDDLEEC